MREIKFRAWNGVEMVQNVAVIGGAPAIEEGASNEPDIIVNGKSYSCDWDYYQPKSNWKLMQYTGLKDKNGVEIYEGDIVSYSRDENDEWHKKSIVIFNQITTQYQLNTSLGSHDLCEWYELEVIGNIHENPELLENNND